MLIDNTGTTIIPKLEIANTFFRRFVGLQLRSSLPSDSGIWISPCSSIHTCFMRFPIDVWMLDRNGIILHSKRNVYPWRIVVAPRGTHSIVETMAGTLSLANGQQVKVTQT
ncbi:MAG: DUF192 domain-containing protein [Planctomycetes bacterium]|nr:DUF192 domain-containing protein [Planctomycetota bacterium]